MILIKNIEFYKVDKNKAEIIKPHEPLGVFSDKGDTVVPAYEIHELIKGRLFVRPDGEQLIIGNSKQAQDVLGLQYEAFENMERELENTHYRLFELSQKIDKIKNASFLTRLKWIFLKVRL